MGFTPQKPLRRVYEQNPAAVHKGLDEEYQSISTKAKIEMLRSIESDLMRHGVKAHSVSMSQFQLVPFNRIKDISPISSTSLSVKGRFSISTRRPSIALRDRQKYGALLQMIDIECLCTGAFHLKGPKRSKIQGKEFTRTAQGF